MDCDLYEIDSFHKKLQDFLSSLDFISDSISEMTRETLLRLNVCNLDNSASFGNNTLIDLCEKILMRKIEILHCLSLANRTQKLCEKALKVNCEANDNEDMEQAN